MNIQLLDYRNAKYQGFLNNQKERHGIGILIDDDLTFYISNWKHNQLNGPTLLYISHGKYIYGEWRKNQPNGLNVFRCGQTVLIGKFNKGQPEGRCLIIFEKLNMACIMEKHNTQWSIVQKGTLLSYKTLLKYIESIDILVPDHYFSLTKFICSFANSSHYIKTFPCNKNDCYAGFSNGLAMIFTIDNSLVSVGYHINQQICQFGGRFKGFKLIEEGNFEAHGEKVTYSGQRPTSRIYAIFQKLHKTSINFVNQYFDPKVKVFTQVQYLLRSKLTEIQSFCRATVNIKPFDLVDSLDYKEYTEEESLKINNKRQQLYSPNKNQKMTSNNLNLSNKIQIPCSPSNNVSQKFFSKLPKTPKKQEPQIISHRSWNKKDSSPLKFFENKKKVLQSSDQNIKNQEKQSFKKINNNNTSPFQSKNIQKNTHIPVLTIQTNLVQQNYFDNTSIQTPKSCKKTPKNSKYKNEVTTQCQIKKGPTSKTNCIYKQQKVIFSQPQPILKINGNEPYFNSCQKLEKIQQKSQFQSKFAIKTQIKKQSYAFSSKQTKQNCFLSKYTKNQQNLKERVAIKDVNQLSKPVYEDIQARRKRILQQFQKINKETQTFYNSQQSPVKQSVITRRNKKAYMYLIDQ